ncbi:hypothetical protein IKE07_01015, partial [Candidatus Saccharibacteria bacterium]|nr:hypothetical protein [Candidatus Saccharibacteria bacterium]
IMVTHNPNLTAYATRVINMLDGQIDTDIKTVADKDLPQPVAVHFRKRKILKEVKEAITGNDEEEAPAEEPSETTDINVGVEAETGVVEVVRDEKAEQEQLNNLEELKKLQEKYQKKSQKAAKKRKKKGGK